MEDNLKFILDQRQPQYVIRFKKISTLTSPSLTSAWHSSAPACFIIFSK
jgi:hypothetical protein